MKKLLFFLLVIKFSGSAFCQVNLQTGSAQFSLPMFSWQDDKSRLNAAVALNYNSANGLKVNEIASNVGQGWSLMAGGVINRMQVGEPDDQYLYNGKGDHTDQDISKYPSGILYATVQAFKGCPTALTKYPIYGWKNQVYTQRSLIAEDKQLDYFSFQFNGKVGMFVLDPTNIGVAKSLGDTKMKITFQLDPNLINLGIRTRITSFSIQDEDGIIYKFSYHGKTKVLQFNYCDASLNQSWTQPDFKNGKVYHQSGFDNNEFSYPWVINSWYLSEIEDPLTLNADQVTKRKITYTYNNATQTNTSIAGEDITYNPDKDYSIISHKKSVTQTPEISSIMFPDGHNVQFNYGLSRLDLSGALAMTSVDISYQGRYISKYMLNTTYVILNRYGTPVSDYQKKVARLYLRSVRKIGVDLKEDTPPYIFDYYLSSKDILPDDDDFVPPPFFYAKDIWGFYNGKNSVGVFGEAISLNGSISDLSNNQLQGLCFRRAGVSGLYLNTKSKYAKNGLLRQIIYPTSGTLTYEYDQNTGVLNGVTSVVGGVHVSKTSSTDGGYSNGCDNPITTTYNFVLNGTGSPSSLWGLEMPVNTITTSTHFQPEYKSYHWTLGTSPFGECYWHFLYPGIASQQQAVNMSWLVQTLNDISPYLGVVSIVSTIMDIATVVGGGSPVSLIIDIIGGLITVGLTCIGNQAKDQTVTTNYNADLNGIAPLPSQFKRVEVIEGDGSSGKTVQEFTSDDDYPIWQPTNSIFSAKQRFAPWAYGLPKLTTIFNASGDKVKQIINVYDFQYAKKIIDECNNHILYCDPNNLTGIQSLLISCKCQVFNSTSQRNTNWSDPSQYSDSYQTVSNGTMGVEFYGMYTGRIELDTTIERTFKQSEPTKYLDKVTSYTYNTYFNYQVNSITTTQSNSAVKNLKEILYTGDFATSQNSALNLMYQKNMVNVPVSVINKVLNPSFSNQYGVLSEKVTEFAILSNGDVRPSKILEQRFAQPNTSTGQYWPDNTNNSTKYKTLQSLTYDNVTSNLIGQTDEGNRIVTNIYDYQDKYVVASVINADAIADRCAYTSFETPAYFGGWVLTGNGTNYPGTGVTGAKAFSLNGNTLTRSALNSIKPYTLSFWANTAGVSVTTGATLVKTAPVINGFTYYEYSIAAGTTSVSLTGNADIDELRLYPATARIRTSTYDPLIGKTSECDENNRITYYDYDNLGRLQYIKDESRNIVKMYEYNTVSISKQIGCPVVYYNHLVSEVFTRSNCGAGYVGTNVVFTRPAGMFSSTISQEDADAKAENDIFTNGQAYANTNGTCQQLFYNTIQTQSFPRENCPVGYIGASIVYTVPANRYSSLISVADANLKALLEIAANGDAYANSPANSVCTIDNNPTWSWLEGAGSYCSSVSGTQHLFIFETNINPNSSTYNQTRWYDMGPQDACPTICSFAASPGFGLSYSTLSLAGSSANFTIVFHSSSGTTNWSSVNQVANITGGCKPSATRIVTATENNRIWEITVGTDGTFKVRLTSGIAPTGTSDIGFSSSYNL